MEGLASIALAVDFLEKREELLKQGKEINSNIQSSLPAATLPIPQGSSFANTPRRVSSDSVCNEAAVASVAPVAPVAIAPVMKVNHAAPVLAPAAAVMDLVQAMPAEDISPDMISQMVESLADDGEFTGPPPAPPAPTHEIARVLDCDVLCGRGGETK